MQTVNLLARGRERERQREIEKEREREREREESRGCVRGGISICKRML